MCQNIGDAIKWRRTDFRNGRGMTQEILAERVGVSREYIGRVEAGKHRRPELGFVLLLARALELKDDDTSELLLDCGHDRLPDLVSVDRPTVSAFLR